MPFHSPKKSLLINYCSPDDDFFPNYKSSETKLKKNDKIHFS